MKICVVVLAAALLAVCAIAASAAVYPTFDGATGVVTLPTAEIAPQGTVNLALSYMEVPQDGKLANARINYAVGKNLELWVGEEFFRGDDWSNEEIMNGGVKFRLLSQENTGIDLAIGGSVGRDQWRDNREDVTKAFLAISKDFTLVVPARLTVGAMFNRFENDDWSEEFTQPYAALELLDVKGLNIGVEYRQRDDDLDDSQAPLSAVMRYSVPDHPVWIEIGTTNASWTGLSWAGQRGFFGIGYAFGGE